MSGARSFCVQIGRDFSSPRPLTAPFIASMHYCTGDRKRFEALLGRQFGYCILFGAFWRSEWIAKKALVGFDGIFHVKEFNHWTFVLGPLDCFFTAAGSFWLRKTV